MLSLCCLVPSRFQRGERKTRKKLFSHHALPGNLSQPLIYIDCNCTALFPTQRACGGGRSLCIHWCWKCWSHQKIVSKTIRLFYMCFAWMVKVTHGVLSCLQTAVCKLPLGVWFFSCTVFTRFSAAALFKFSDLQMRRSFGSGAQSGGGVNYNKNF
jgi:hypothetical protein